MKQVTAADIMTEDVLAARADWTLDRLSDFFVENSISGAPVVAEDGTLIGVVSLTDLVRHKTLPLKSEACSGPHEYYLQTLEYRFAAEEIASFRIKGETLDTARDIMTPIVFKVTEKTRVQQVADTMIRGHIHRLFVTRKGRVVGIITALDLIKVIRDL